MVAEHEPASASSNAARTEGGPQSPRCRICGSVTDPASPHFPFCSQRCRLADLNRWFGGAYKISRPANDPKDWEAEAGP